MRAFGIVCVAALAATVGCERRDDNGGVTRTTGQPEAQSQQSTVTKAICVLHPTGGNEVRGTVTFTQEGDKVLVEAEITGLKPGKHGFHIHEWGDCSDLEANAAGGHFNPTGAKHGDREDKERHAGDLGNVDANEDGKAILEWRDPVIKLMGPHSIIGRSVIVHADADDLTSQPTGNSGARVACGVIGIAKP